MICLANPGSAFVRALRSDWRASSWTAPRFGDKICGPQGLWRTTFVVIAITSSTYSRTVYGSCKVGIRRQSSHRCLYHSIDEGLTVKSKGTSRRPNGICGAETAPQQDTGSATAHDRSSVPFQRPRKLLPNLAYGHINCRSRGARW